MMRYTRQQIRREIEALVHNDGMVYAPEVVEWARANPASALHAQFDWDVNRAAHKYWLEQARTLIQVYVTNEAGARTTISLVSDRKAGGGYRDLDSVLSNREMRAEAVRQALDDLERWRQRNGHLGELRTLFRTIDRAFERLRPAPPDAAA
jgi:hypothetical protein